MERWLVAAVAMSLCACEASPLDRAVPDLAPPPQTIHFEISSFTGSGVFNDGTTVSFPLPTPTLVPVDGIEYVYRGLHEGRYDCTLEWLDKRNDNQGWSASFGGAPGVSASWPLMSRRLAITNGSTELGPDKVAFVAGAGARPNTLFVTIRSADDPQNDYGILEQGVKGD
jgi:hypothetical protein